MHPERWPLRKHLHSPTVYACHAPVLPLRPAAAGGRATRRLCPGQALPYYPGRVGGLSPFQGALVCERDHPHTLEAYRLDSKGQIGTWYRYPPDSVDAPVKLLASTGLLQPGTDNAEWKVCFFGLFKTQYLIGWLAPDYRVVMVVRDARDYLWCMARTPVVPAADYQVMLDLASALDYDASRIERVPQRWQETRQDKDTFHGECQ